MTTVVNVKVKHIRPDYDNLKEWMENPNHEYTKELLRLMPKIETIYN